MRQRRHTKFALLSSIITMLLCFAMLLGTTFAWFTENTSTAVSPIQSGNLNVALEYALQPEAGKALAWMPATDAGVDLFADASWEPGFTGIIYFRVKNTGSLAMKYRLTLEVAGNTLGTNNEGTAIDLTKYLQLAVVGDGASASTPLPFSSRNAAAALFGDDSKSMSQILNPEGVTGVTTGVVYRSSADGQLGATDATNVSGAIAVVVRMPENIGNEANARSEQDLPSISLKLNVDAAQAKAEYDSFGNQYDATAAYAETTEATTNNEP